MATEAEVLQDLLSKWISIALEYAGSAPDVRAVYIYASSERGSSFVNAYFDQAGVVVFPEDLKGTDTSKNRIRQVQRFLTEDLFEAEDRFKAANIPRPTEYRVYYESATKKLDSQLSRDEQYGDDTDRTPIRGIEYWLGGRAPKLY
ncbi:hypothetical protein LQ938_11510 [Microbacterium sp. cx-55]|uniref:hypothetical protein n=1 Tax=Microbacterium sp. cx-55 TaxID=2875948 RepID=UPI001CBAF84C|nr:hypothetical protein [Microbacterium sp. cx-55]MBZ4488098.1 hypothetical protein [Microbacterium sp. cx-55]UGB34493.1 hypothetical protein LQ938_11510 [Microbacterium sp. cx-55]